VQEREHDPDLREPHPRLTDDVLRRRPPFVREPVVVALCDEAVRRVAPDDAMDHDDPGTEVPLRDLVRDDVALAVIGVLVRDDEVAADIGGQHGHTSHHDVAGGALEHARTKREEPSARDDERKHDPGCPFARPHVV
jgi:hypothetical protein